MTRIAFAGCLLLFLVGASVADAADLPVKGPTLPPPPFS